jgi:hypothetical protein
VAESHLGAGGPTHTTSCSVNLHQHAFRLTATRYLSKGLVWQNILVIWLATAACSPGTLIQECQCEAKRRCAGQEAETFQRHGDVCDVTMARWGSASALLR